MGIYAIKPKFQQALRTIERPLVRWRVHPDVITISALVLSGLGGLAILASSSNRYFLLTVPFIAMIRIAFNALDGMVAKDLGVARPWGEVLNELCDRLADAAFFVAIVFVPGVNIPLAVSVLALTLITSYIGVLAKAVGVARQYGGMMGKADRMILLSVASIVGLFLPVAPVFNWFLALVLIGLIMTMAQRLRRTHVALKSVR